MDLTGFGDRLKHARERAGLSQSKLAELADTTQNSISDWERKKTTISLDKLFLLASALDVSVLYLLGYTDPDSQINHIYQQMNEQNRTILLEIARTLYRLQQDSG
jgi:transcriptional regulator with XRE-family HTH domain